MDSYSIYRLYILKIKNNTKFLFFSLTIFRTLFLISSSSWLLIWIWLEINLIIFIAYIINNKNKLSIESALIYFLIQTIASIILIFSIIIIQFFIKFLNLIIISLILKIRIAPFHYWIILIIENLNWIKIFLILTWQKINPLIILYYLFNIKIFNLFIIFSIIIRTISRLNYYSLKKIIAFSSINQLRWILLTLNLNKLINLYLIFYFYIIWTILKLFKYINFNFLNQIYRIKFKTKFLKIFLFFRIFSLAGLPPFLGFFPKIIIIFKINNIYIIFILLIFSIIILFLYLRISISIILINSYKINFINNRYSNNNLIIFLNFSILNNILIFIIFFIF